MKKVSRFLTINLVISLSFCFFFSSAATRKRERSPELDAMSDKELLTSVDAGKSSELVSAFQTKEATRLYNGPFNPKKTGANVETYRNKEVIIITIPTDKLFDPNATSLKRDADNLLIPLKRYMKSESKDMYRVLMVMHTDNSGSETYTDNLSLKRAESVFNWFEANGCDTDYLFMRARGASEPNMTSGTIEDIIGANDTYEKRAANRRLEIFLIPGKRMIEAAKKGRISF